jgi:hypothetical protein
MRIEPRVKVRLSHVTERRQTFTEEKITYRIQSSWADRPPAGITKGRMTCFTCEKPVTLRIYGPDALRRAQRRWLIGVIISGLYLAACVTGLVVWGEDPGWVIPVCCFTGVFAAFALWITAVSRWRDAGVRIDRREDRRYHLVIPVHAYFGGWNRKEREAPEGPDVTPV